MTSSKRGDQRSDRLVTTYRKSLQWRKSWRRLSEGVFDGVWLGLLDQHQQREVDRAFFAVALEPVDGGDYKYTDPVHIRSGLMEWERSVVEEFDAGGTVVVTSAGAGREVHALAEMGFDVYGFEPNTSLVEAGRAVLADPSRLAVSEWDQFPPFDGEADAVVIGWGSYMMVAGRPARIKLLEDARSALRPGGLMLVSYYDRPNLRYFHVARSVGSLVRRMRGREPLEFGDSLTPNFVHYFSPDEASAEIAAAGFEIVRAARAPYGHVLARRP